MRIIMELGSYSNQQDKKRRLISPETNYLFFSFWVWNMREAQGIGQHHREETHTLGERE